MTDRPATHPKTVGDYLQIARRRVLLIIALPVIAGAAALVLSHTQKPLYAASAQILVKRTSVVTAVTNVQDPAGFDPTRFLATQAAIARAPELAIRVAAASGIPGMTPGRVLGETRVTPQTDVDLLGVTASDRSPRNAVNLANIYATEFTRYKSELDTATINNAITSLRQRERVLAARGAVNSGAYATLIQYEGELASVGKQLANNTKVLQPAEGAAKIRPRTRRNVIASGLLGLILGLGVAFVAEALDRRVRSEGDIDDALDVPALARVPQPSRHARKRNELVLITEPQNVDAEIFRKLRTSIEFVNIDHQAQTMMVTSAVSREGKSTTIANLAVAFARAGRRVALVDLDLREPTLHRFFRLGSKPGISDVVVERASLADALRPVALPSESTGSRSRTENGSGRNGRHGVEGVLHVLPAGTLPPSASEFVARDRVASVISELAQEFDHVLIDAPPMLAFGDAMSLSPNVDAIFVVVRMNVVQRTALQELGRQLRSCRAVTLGYVATGVGHGEAYRYGYDAYRYAPRASTEEPRERV
jgi:Mrp family chromosome partitioning ATPase/capsular polysaccharide biosynthesis protein